VAVVWIDQVLPSQRSASGSEVPTLLISFPTAVHAVAEVHDTPDKLMLAAPLGVGVVWIVHVLPSQRSASVPPLPDPRAVHAVADVHETAFRVTPPFGVAWIVQVRPSQASASVRSEQLNPQKPIDPTAVHAVAEVHDTPFRLIAAPLGLGVVWIVQVRPSQRSASVPVPLLAW
jgi:hypothetical protein